MARTTIGLPRKNLALLSFTAALILSFGALLFMDVQSVHGLGVNYFDDDGSSQSSCDVYDRAGNELRCSTSEMLLMIGQTQYVRKTGTKLRAYFKNNRGFVTIINHHWCPGNSFGDLVETEDNDQGVAVGSAVTKINIPGTGDVYGRRYRAGDARCDDKIQVSLSSYLKDGTAIGLPGFWYADFSLDHVDQASGYDGTQNAMQVQLSSGSGYSYDSTNDYLVAPLGHRHGGDAIKGHAVTVEQKSGPTNYGLKVRFGTDCDVTSNANHSIHFYDLDGGDDGGAQRNGPIRLKLKGVTPGGDVRWWNGSNWNDTTEPSYSDARVAPTVANSDWAWGFEARPGWQYELQVLNIYSNNTLQLSTPFDSVYGIRDCERPDVPLRATAAWSQTDALEPGETSNFTPYIDNASTSRTGYVNDTWRRVWFDATGDEVYNTGDSLQANQDHISARTAVGPNNLSISNVAYTANGAYAKLCGQLYNVVADNPAGRTVDTLVLRASHTSCIRIAKYPAMVVRGGDVRTGGVYPSSAIGTCQLGPSALSGAPIYKIRGHLYRDPARTNPNKAYKGGFTDYGLFTPGPTSSFGSGGAFYQGVGTSSGQLLFGTQGWGSAEYGYGAEGQYLGTGIVATTPTHCLPNAEKQYPAPTAVTTFGAAETEKKVAPTTSQTYDFGTGSNKILRLCANTAACPGAGSSTIAVGQRVVIRVTQSGNSDVGNTVYLNNSILYGVPAAPGYASLSQIPQFVLIVDKPIKLRIAKEATEINGLIATRGNIFTCETYGSTDINDLTIPFTTNDCLNALSVKGGVITDQRLMPYRTSGFNTKADTTNFAETFTLTPETLLSDYAWSQAQSGLKTDYQAETSPRF